MLETFRRHESRVRSYVRSFPAVFSRARGHELITEEGRSYIDFFAGAGALNYGHNHPHLKQALLDYVADDGITHSLDMATVAKRAFIERFQEVVLGPRDLEYKMLFPGPTGTNAVEAALKIARKATGRRTVYAFERAFHGMTLGALAVTSNTAKRRGAGQPLHYTRQLPYDGVMRDGRSSLEVLSAELDADAAAGKLPAAVILETVQCEGGVHAASREWLEGVQRLCAEHEVLLIVDDIQAGCGRTGRFFSFEDAGLRPDIVCLSKSLSGMGLPFALVLHSPEIDVFEPGEHNGTFRGHNPAFVTATAALDFWLDGELSRQVDRKAGIVRMELERLASEHSDFACAVRGRGLVQGLQLSESGMANAVSAAAFERGLVIETAGHEDDVVKVLPPLTIPEAALRAGLKILAEAVSTTVGGATTSAK